MTWSENVLDLTLAKALQNHRMTYFNLFIFMYVNVITATPMSKHKEQVQAMWGCWFSQQEVSTLHTVLSFS